MATRVDIRNRAQTRADQLGKPFPGDSAYNGFIDESARKVYYDLVLAGFPFDVSFASINVAALGSEEVYTINGGNPILGVKGVFRIENGKAIELSRLNLGHEASLRSTQGQPSFALEYEAVVNINTGPGIKLYPVPTTGLYHVYFHPQFENFVNDASVWRGPHMSDEMIVLDAARKGVLMEDDKQKAKSFDDEYQRLYIAVSRAAGQFDMRNAPKIREVSEVFRDPFDYDVKGVI